MSSKSSVEPQRDRERAPYHPFALVALILVLGFLTLLIIFLLWPPVQGFHAFVAQETARIALQLIGITFVGFLVSELVRIAREKEDFARRARAAYGKAKASRRRLRWVSPEKRLKELMLLNDVQIEFENLKEEAEQKFGREHEVVTNLGKIEVYLNNVIDGGVPQQTHTVEGDAFQDFIAKFEDGSRFDTDLKRAYGAVRTGLRRVKLTRAP
jgi:hypothetical protein